MKQALHVHVEGKNYAANSLACSILNAFYSALILKKMEGVEITPEIEDVVLEAVVRRMSALEKMIRIAESVPGAKEPR